MFVRLCVCLCVCVIGCVFVRSRVWLFDGMSNCLLVRICLRLLVCWCVRVRVCVFLRLLARLLVCLFV